MCGRSAACQCDIEVFTAVRTQSRIAVCNCISDYTFGGASFIGAGNKEKQIEDILKETYKSTITSHNHEESVKATKAVTLAIHLAKNKASKYEIKRTIEIECGYNFDFDLPISKIFGIECTCTWESI